MMYAPTDTRSSHPSAMPMGGGLLVPEDERPFRPGDAVVYRAHGVGLVDRIGERLVGSEQIEMIQVVFRSSRMILLIPTSTASRSGLRHVSSQAIIDTALLIITGPSRPVRGPWAKKRDVIERKINSGRMDQLAEVVRDLRCRPDGKAQSFSEMRLFEAAMVRFVGELAATMGRTEQETSLQVRAVLEHADPGPVGHDDASGPEDIPG